MPGPNTIMLKLNGFADRREEARAVGVIKPGMILNIDLNSKPLAHATAGGDAGAGNTPVYVALEDDFQGKTIDDTYAVGDVVFYHIAQKGDEFYAILPTGQSVTPASRLTSNGDGKVKLANGTTDKNMFRPVETLNNASGGDLRLRVQVL